MKKSFILYHDACENIFDLSNEDAGIVFKDIIFHSFEKNNHNPKKAKKPNGLNGLLSIVSTFYKDQIDRDLENYNKIVEVNKNNGKKGGRPKKKNPIKAKKADKDKDKDKDKEKEIYNIYPRKIGGAKAIESITKALTKISYEELREKVKTYAEQSKETEPQFIPHPSTWFNQERWLDVQQIKNNKVFLNLI
jgi:hypothetical protein